MEGLLFVDLFFVKLLEPPRYRAAISGRVPSDRYLANLPYYSTRKLMLDYATSIKSKLVKGRVQRNIGSL